MPNSSGTASPVARITPRRKPKGQTEVTFVLTAVYTDSSGQIISRSDPGTVFVDLAAGTGEMLALIFSQLLHGLPQANRVAAP
jgi:hypothetical protein